MQPLELPSTKTTKERQKTVIVDKAKAVAFLVALGFAKAPEWDDAKLKQRLDQVPSKVDEEDVPDGFESFYTSLVDSEADDPIEFGKPKKDKKGKAKAAKPAPAPAPAPAKKGKAKAAKKAEPPTPPPAKEKKAAKPAPAPAKTVERDAFGQRVGTISATINALLEPDWVDEQDIVKAAGVTLEQARGRLYYAEQEGVIECRRLVQYRLTSKAPKAAREKK